MKRLLVKEPSHFNMLESKLWHSETETKNVKGVKMVGFIKTCDQYLFFLLSHSFFLPFSEIDFTKPLVLEKW